MARRERFLTRGLALTDALVMVAVIALMFSILFPVLAKARESARRSMCADNMHHLMAAVLSYANDHGGKGPMRGWFSYTVAETMREAYGSGGYARTMVNLGMLYKEWIGGHHDMLYCPSTYDTIRDMPSNGRGGGWKTAFEPGVYWTYGSYNYGEILSSRTYEHPGGSQPGRSPDLSGPNPFPPEVWSSRMADWVAQWELDHPGVQFEVPGSPALVTDWWVGYSAQVHKSGINVLYTDGHVRFHDIGNLGVTSGHPLKYEVWYKLSLNQ